MNPRTLAVALVATVAVSFVALGLQRETQRDRLRVIVQQQCVPHWLATHRPTPCSSVTLLERGGAGEGYAVLPDRKGGAHYLLLPTRTVRGIESPEALQPDAPNYFAAAWQARTLLVSVAERPLPRTAVALALNPLHARSQDQLHIHMSCLRPAIAAQLGQRAPQITPRWGALQVDGHAYQAMRVMGDELAGTNPIRLLAQGVPGARRAMQDYTLLVAGEQFEEGPGFILLAGRDVPGAELLLDATCAVAD